MTPTPAAPATSKLKDALDRIAALPPPPSSVPAPSVEGLDIEALENFLRPIEALGRGLIRQEGRTLKPSTLRALLSALRQFQAREERMREALRDKARLDWLELHDVNVRVPLVHGSRTLFWATYDDSFEGEEGPSDIRAKIDAALGDPA